MADLNPLRRRMIEDMTVRNLSPATQRSYLHAVTKFSRYFGRSPDRLGLEDVRAFQVHLVSTGISWPALNQTVCALRFFYGVTLGHDEIPERIPYAREPRKLPVVLSADEVVRFLEAVPSLKTRAALTTAYAAGLRASETVGLKVGDVDSGRMIILVEHGKGGKDRTVMLSAQLLGILRTYWRLSRPRHWLFPGRDQTKPIDVQVLHAACRSARAAAGLTKRVSDESVRWLWLATLYARIALFYIATRFLLGASKVGRNAPIGWMAAWTATTTLQSVGFFLTLLVIKLVVDDVFVTLLSFVPVISPFWFVPNELSPMRYFVWQGVQILAQSCGVFLYVAFWIAADRWICPPHQDSLAKN